MTGKRSSSFFCSKIGFVSSLTLLSCSTAFGAGFQIKEQSAALQGSSFAGATAEALDSSYQHFNPAALGFLDRFEAQIDSSVIAPSVSYDIPKVSSPFGGKTSGRLNDIAYIPSGYVNVPVTDRLKLGLAVTAPFGLATKYDSNWVGRFDSIHGKLTTINISPTVAYKIHDTLSIAVGFQAQYAKATLTSSVPILFPGSVFPTESSSKLEGDDWGFGYTAGLLWEPLEGTRVGLSYRSKIIHRLKGDFKVGALPGSFDIKTNLTLPSVISLGAYHEINASWAIMGDVSWTKWTDLDTLTITTALGDKDVLKDWGNSWFVSLGTKYTFNNQWSIRGGVAYDTSPIPKNERRPAIPDGDRIWASLGVTYNPTENISLSAGYSHIFFGDTDLTLPTTKDRVNYSNNIDILSFSVGFHF